MIIEEEFIYEGCIHIGFYSVGCALGFEQGKDEFAQTFPIYSLHTKMKCRHKRTVEKSKEKRS